MIPACGVNKISYLNPAIFLLFQYLAHSAIALLQSRAVPRSAAQCCEHLLLTSEGNIYHISRTYVCILLGLVT